MTGGYRVSLLRAGGWNRLGFVAALGIVFGTPMLWTLGAFGSGEDALHRALVFLVCGIFFSLSTGYGVGWAVLGFVLRVKESEEEEGGASRRRIPPPPAGAPSPPRAGSAPRPPSAGH